MEPLEKAKQLIEKFKPSMYCYMGSGMLTNSYDEGVATSNAINCALMLIDEVIATDMLIDEDTYVNTAIYLYFWIDVKKELITLKNQQTNG